MWKMDVFSPSEQLSYLMTNSDRAIIKKTQTKVVGGFSYNNLSFFRILTNTRVAVTIETRP